ncbi:TonB-linked SusC/RagA family outer membrane protein [Pedobacter sp. AK017]|uniref:SusC/RagA family TonB-linked outer membrane protein n=1 Tax=Pedobacter sp. AK017 TaxID=2723073 RepID=UPI001610C6E7|nr:TonB-dependent receptor [Pedobacter sp. AK017]MBB5440259.1 TonB-linked SusC/RagA family outer membrane protein [Pedobacter sp. AK017]
MKQSSTQFCTTSYRIRNYSCKIKPGRLLFSLLVFLQLLSLNTFAQEKVITGVVTDAEGKGMPGVSVKVKNSTTGTSTLADGKFSLRLPANNTAAVLVISYIGFVTQEVVPGNKTQINVNLKEDNSALNEVVVIGYGAVKKPDLTGAVGVVNMEDVNKAPVASVDEALAGRVAGVQIISPDGQPGAVSDIQVRGTGSITNSSSPLYVIDGFAQEGNALNTISPNDIESISVLKDASSTAIYGSRGANGVVLITTKRGKAGTPQIAYNVYAGTQSNISAMKVMDAYDFVRLQIDIDKDYGRAAYLTNGRTLESYRNSPSIDWQDKVFQVAPFMNHNLTLSGRADKTNYYISGNYVDQTGLVVASGFKRYQGRITLDQEISKNFKAGVTANFSQTRQFGNSPRQQSIGIPSNASGSGTNSADFNLMFSIWSSRPVNASGDLSQLEDNFSDADEASPRAQDRINPYLLALNSDNVSTEKNLLANSYAEVTFLKDFKLRSTFNINVVNRKVTAFNNRFTRGGSPFTIQGRANGINGSIDNIEEYGFENVNTLTYKKTINKAHTVTALAGFSNQLRKSDRNLFSAIQVPNESLGINGIDEGTVLPTTVTASQNNLASFFGRLDYNYKSKYIFTATFRADGSSKFPTANKWGYFPSAALKWNIAQESFMKPLENVISNSGLRISYGLGGNNRVGDYPYQSRVEITSAIPGTRSSFNNSILPGAAPVTMSNPYLKWETAKMLDIGLELGFLKDRFALEVDYYNKKTYNLLLGAQLPPNMGFGSILENIGDIQNEGIEISFTSNNIRNKNFTWSTSLNITFARNEVLGLARNQRVLGSNPRFSSNYTNPLYIAQIGEPIARFFGYISDGLYRLEDFDVSYNGAFTNYRLKPNVPVFNNATQLVQPGDVKFKDLNGDGVIDVGDLTIIGNPNPSHIGGISNNFTYKGFDLGVFFQWSYGNQVYNANRTVMEGGTNGDNRNLGLNMFAQYADYYTVDNDDAQYPRPLVNAFGVRNYSTRFIEDASYLRLKTVNLGYNFSGKLLSKVKISNARLYVSAQNLYTWTNYSGPDPEVSTQNSSTTPGFDYSPYPRTRTVVLGANVTF